MTPVKYLFDNPSSCNIQYVSLISSIYILALAVRGREESPYKTIRLQCFKNPLLLNNYTEIKISVLVVKKIIIYR